MSSLNNAHIESFDQYGAQFWDENGAYRTLHHINPVRVDFIKQFINLNQKTILDIGCGGGLLSEALAREGAQVFGIDLSSSMIAAAEHHLSEQNLAINYRQISSHDCCAQNEQYDHIVCMEMLEHVANPAAILRDIYALLRPNGFAFLSTVNRNKRAFFKMIVLAEYLTKLVPRGTHHYANFIRPHELVTMAERAGLSAVALSGMTYHPLRKSAHLSRHLNTHYLLAVQKKS